MFTGGLYLLLNFGLLLQILGILFMMAGLSRFSLPFIEDYFLAKQDPNVRVINRDEEVKELGDDSS